MSEAVPDPTTTRELFEHERVADGYASARPFLHPQVFARLRQRLPSPRTARRGLDVGCGTGLSSVALLELAPEVVGIDAAAPMLRRARTTKGIHYLVSSAEDLPFRDGSFDLVVACGSIDWVDRERFLPRAARLLEPGGWLVPLDFGDSGRSPDVEDLEGWHREVFLARFPRPWSRDPMVTGPEARRFGFEPPDTHTFEIPCAFSAERYADFLMTESNVIAAVEYGGDAAREIRDWLGRELLPILGAGERPVLFGGYMQLLRRR